MRVTILVNKLPTYKLLGKILALDSIPGHGELIIAELQQFDQWQNFVSLADKHLILQALYPKIRDHNLQQFLPEELLEHLKYIFQLTTDRNLEIIKQAGELNDILLNSGIKAIFMKGVGNILDGLYRYPGERILHDIDILVPDEMFEKAAEILLLDGYKSNYKYDPTKKHSHRHYPILYKPGEPVYAELHLSPVGGSSAKHFTNDIIFHNARPALVLPGFLVMSDEHKMIHNFLHAQIGHVARIYAREFIRNLYDLLLLSSRANPETVFSKFHHFRRTSSGYLDICYFTFGITPAKRTLPPFFLHSYRYRYRLNLRCRFVSVTSSLIIRIFIGYIVKPFRALFDKDLRMQLLSKLRDPAWYKKQGSYYGRLFKKDHRP